MSSADRAAYIRGMMDGMELDPSAKETKLLDAIVDLMGVLANSADELEQEVSEMADRVDEIDADLGDLEQEVYGGFEDEDEGCGCGHHHHGGCGCGHHAAFEVVCPSCGETIGLTDEMLDEESVICPGCGETLEFDFCGDEDEDCEDEDVQAPDSED